MTDPNRVLVRAIEQKRRLRFLYNGRERIVEPQCYGIGTKGTELLRVHQLQGGREREPLFDVSKITGLKGHGSDQRCLHKGSEGLTESLRACDSPLPPGQWLTGPLLGGRYERCLDGGLDLLA